MQSNELTTIADDPFTTISGKPVTHSLSFRFPLSKCMKIRKIALKKGKTVSELLQEWTFEKLSEYEPVTNKAIQFHEQRALSNESITEKIKERQELIPEIVYEREGEARNQNFMIRIPKTVAHRLKILAAVVDVTLNKYIASVLLEHVEGIGDSGQSQKG